MASSNFKNTSTSLIMDGNVLSNKGMLGGTLFISTTVNFSIDPLLLSGSGGRYYNKYIVDLTGSAGTVIVSLPDLATMNKGWECTILNKNTAGAFLLQINNFSGTQIGLLRTNFSCTVIVDTGLWNIIYHVPKTGATTESLVYDANGYPQLGTISVSAQNNRFSSKSNNASNFNGTTPQAIRWNLTVKSDLTTYNNNTSTGVITVLKTGRYIIDCAIGLNPGGGATNANLQIQARVNSILYNFCFISIGSINLYATYTYRLYTMLDLTAGNTVEIVGYKTIAGGGSLQTVTGNGTWISVNYTE